MTRFDDLFVDVSAYQPPSKWEARISNLLVLLIAGLLLMGGWMFKDWMEEQFRYLALAENEIAIPYPPAWTLQPHQELALQVLDPDGPALFPAREEVRILPLPATSFMHAWPAHRAAELGDYIELATRPLTLRDGRNALLIEYSYATQADASFVAVHAVDLAFPARYEDETRLVVVTLAAEASDWDRVWPTFQRILEKLRNY